MIPTAQPTSFATQGPFSLLAESTELWVYVLPVIGSMMLCYGIFQVIVDSKGNSKKKVHDRLQGKRSAKAEKSAANILRRGAMGAGSGMAEVIVGQLKFVPKLQTLLDQADVDWSASQTLLNLCGLGLLSTVGLALMQFSLMVAIGCGVATVVIPIFWLYARRQRRLTKLTSQLPDVFDMMSQALRAGHSLAGAVQLIYEQMPPPIATEFAQVYHEQNLGIQIEDALKAMAKRVDSLDVRFFVTAVMIQRQTGGDLAEVLDNISSVIRERIELAGLVRGLTAEGRLSGWVLFALPSLVFTATWLLNPSYVSILFDDPRGQIMLIVAGGMQLMGIAMIRWIVNIKV